MPPHPKLPARGVNDFWPLQSNRHMLNVTLTAEEFNALIAEREAAFTECKALRDELKVVKIERDLLQEKLNAVLRKLFAAKSEVRGNGQSELFNEAEALASAEGQVTEEVPVESSIEIAGTLLLLLTRRASLYLWCPGF